MLLWQKKVVNLQVSEMANCLEAPFHHHRELLWSWLESRSSAPRVPAFRPTAQRHGSLRWRELRQPSLLPLKYCKKNTKYDCNIINNNNSQDDVYSAVIYALHLWIPRRLTTYKRLWKQPASQSPYSTWFVTSGHVMTCYLAVTCRVRRFDKERYAHHDTIMSRVSWDMTWRAEWNLGLTKYGNVTH